MHVLVQVSSLVTKAAISIAFIAIDSMPFLIRAIYNCPRHAHRQSTRSTALCQGLNCDPGYAGDAGILVTTTTTTTSSTSTSSDALSILGAICNLSFNSFAFLLQPMGVIAITFSYFSFFLFFFFLFLSLTSFKCSVTQTTFQLLLK